MLASAPLFAQVIHIDAGSAADQYYSGGTACIAGTACMPNAAVIPPTLRYGAAFDYNVPAEARKQYLIRITMMDPNSTAVGQRKFTVSVNGRSSAPLDLFALAGNYPYQVLLPATAQNGTINIHFAAQLRNALVQAIEEFDAVMGFTSPGPTVVWVPPNPQPIPFWQPAAFVSWIVGDPLAGSVDGMNTVFTLSRPVGPLSLYRNGLRLKPERDYSVSGQNITMTQPPQPGDVLLVDYQAVK